MSDSHITLVCWTCGLQTLVEGPQPQSAADVVDAANAVRWRYLIGRSSVRVFCRDECSRLSLKKRGGFRARRPPGAPNRSGKWDPRNNVGLPDHMYPEDLR